MAYSPGVGAVCMAIKDEPAKVDTLTLRGRSVAVVTQGNFTEKLTFEPGRMIPIVDWCIAQFKYYAALDSFPFLLRKKANVEAALKDLANSYSMIYWLDEKVPDASLIPKDVTFLHHHEAIKVTNCECDKERLMNCEGSAKILSWAKVNKKIQILS